VITYSSDKAKLQKLEKEFNEKLEASQKEEPINIDETNKQKILALQDNAFYDKDLNKLVFRIYYIEIREELVGVVNIIKNLLESYSI
jgi:hypothetical protein